MTISEISNKYELTQDTLRYYERIGLIPNVNRNENGVRDYREEDCNWIEFIKCMRGAGIPIEALVKYVNLFQQGDKTIESRKEILIEQRDNLIAKIEEMQDSLKRLNHKIDSYDRCLVIKERELAGFND